MGAIQLDPRLFAENSRFGAELFKRCVSSVGVEITSYCNRTCYYCPNSVVDRRSNRQDMPDTVFTAIVEDLASIGYNGSFGPVLYGEPMSNWEYFKCRMKEVRETVPTATINLISNGDYLTRDRLCELPGLGISSLYINQHDTKDKHDRATGLTLLVSRAKKFGLDLKFSRVDGYSILAESEFMGIRVMLSVNNFDHESNRFDRGGFLRSSHVRTSPCFVPVEEFNIDYDGSVTPCCNIRADMPQHAEYVVGKVAGRGDIFSVYANAKLGGWRKSLFSTEAKDPPCKTCRYKEMPVNDSLEGQIRGMRKNWGLDDHGAD